VALVLACAAVLAALALIASRPEPAKAAPCSTDVSSYIVLTGSPDFLGIRGASICSDHDESFRVYCSGGTVLVDYAFIDTNDLSGTDNSGAPCSQVGSLWVDGLLGDDRIDVSAVSPATGFSTISPADPVHLNPSGAGNDDVVGSSFADEITGGAGGDSLTSGPGNDSVNGGTGGDLLFVRDGGPDTADCGADNDAVQADQRSVDAIANCEAVDALPEATTAAVPVPEIVAKKKCKKKHHKHRKCKKHKKR
jgi:hypothetical protein